MKRLATLVLVLPLALTGCGSHSAPSSTPTVQPCDAVDLAAVAKVLGHGLTKDTGTADAPSCTLDPTTKGDPVFQLNYQWWFKGGLEKAWKTMGGVAGHVTSVHVPGADDAKLVVNTGKRAAFVSGFVENGSLVQVVNGAVAPKDATDIPKEVAALRKATLLLMAQVSKGAPSSPTAAASA